MKYFENNNIELKKIINDKIEKSIVAFLNSFDGTIYIGIDDSGEVVGINKTDENLRKIADIASGKIEPSALEFIQAKSIEIDGKHIIEVKVKKGNQAIYYLKAYGLSTRGAFIRVGTSNRSLTNDEIKTRYESQFSAKALSISEIQSRFDSFTFTTLKVYYVGKGFHPNETTFEKNLGLLTKNGKYNLLAEFLADNNRNEIIFARFNGFDKSAKPQMNRYVDECLLFSIDKVLNRFESENYNKSIENARGVRTDIPLFDSHAAYEAFINAIVHNDYMISFPSVHIFDDRLEITSYGGLPIGMTEDMFFSGISIPRNEGLMRILSDLSYVEHTGHGVTDILKVYNKDIFEIAKLYIRVAIPFNKEVMAIKTLIDVSQNVPQNVPQKIVALIHENVRITRKQIASNLGVSVKTVARALKNMTNVSWVGSSKGGHWQIT